MGQMTPQRAIEAWGDMIYRLALTRLQNKEDAEDVYQNTFLKLLEHTEWHDWNQEHIRAWLIRIAVNECADVGRRRGGQPFLTAEELAQAADTAVSQDQWEIWDLVSALGEPDRSIVYLHYGEGYSLKEIADMLGISYGNCRVTLHRARGKLKKELTGKAGDGNACLKSRQSGETHQERRSHGNLQGLSQLRTEHSCTGRA